MPKFVSKKDYYEFSGIDLDIELKKSQLDNPTKAVEIFLNKIENFCLDFLYENYLVEETSELFNIEQFKKGVLHQIDYIRTHGDLTVYNPNGLPVMCKQAKTQFRLGGMTNVAHKRPVSIDPWQ